MNVLRSCFPQSPFYTNTQPQNLPPITSVTPQNSLQKSKRKLLVFINPQSGSGNAKKSFDKEVVPGWTQHNINYEVIETKYAGHCTKYISELTDFENIDFVGVGGDGIISEILEGLAKNPLKIDFKQVAIGHLPAGSGNGLAMSLLTLAGRKFNLTEAAEMPMG